MIRNKKHSELFRAYQKAKQQLATAETMIAYLSYDYRVNRRQERHLATPKEVWDNTEYNECRSARNEARRKCTYLKRMIGEAQREYSRLNQKFSIR